MHEPWSVRRCSLCSLAKPAAAWLLWSTAYLGKQTYDDATTKLGKRKTGSASIDTMIPELPRVIKYMACSALNTNPECGILLQCGLAWQYDIFRSNWSVMTRGEERSKDLQARPETALWDRDGPLLFDPLRGLRHCDNQNPSYYFVNDFPSLWSMKNTFSQSNGRHVASWPLCRKTSDISFFLSLLRLPRYDPIHAFSKMILINAEALRKVGKLTDDHEQRAGIDWWQFLPIWYLAWKHAKDTKETLSVIIPRFISGPALIEEYNPSWNRWFSSTIVWRMFSFKREDKKTACFS